MQGPNSCPFFTEFYLILSYQQASIATLLILMAAYSEASQQYSEHEKYLAVPVSVVTVRMAKQGFTKL